jgi:hypothetical protein
MASIIIALVRCYGLFFRAFPGHVAAPRHQLSDATPIVAVLCGSEWDVSTRCGAIATVFPSSTLKPRP